MTTKRASRISAVETPTLQIKRLTCERRTVCKWLLATVEAIENTQGLKGKHTYIDRAHQEIALKARKVLLKLGPAPA